LPAYSDFKPYRAIIKSDLFRAINGRDAESWVDSIESHAFGNFTYYMGVSGLQVLYGQPSEAPGFQR